MTDTPVRTDATDAYRASVERHLADLPDEIRDDLVADLRAHLNEVASELRPGESLEHRLGDPERYADELRETVELQHVSAAERLRRGLGSAADRYTESAGVGRAADFAASLKPGWWVVRGLLAAMLIGYGATVFGFVQHLLDSRFVPHTAIVWWSGLLMTLALVWFSLRLGARSELWSARARKRVAAGGIAVVAAGAWCAFLTFGHFASLAHVHQQYLTEPGTVVEVGEDGTLHIETGG